jgi:hypothetical protein
MSKDSSSAKVSLEAVNVDDLPVDGSSVDDSPVEQLPKSSISYLDRQKVVQIFEDNELHDILPSMYKKIPESLNDEGQFNELCSLFEMVVNQTNSVPELKNGNANLEFEARIGKFIKTQHKSYFNSEQKYNDFNRIINYLMNLTKSDDISSLNMVESTTLEIGMQEKNLVSKKRMNSSLGEHFVDMGNSNIRFVIKDIKNIQRFCQINSNSVDFKNKGIHQHYNNLLEIPDISILKKRGYSGQFPYLKRTGANSAGKLLSWKTDIHDYNFRIATNIEENIHIEKIDESKNILLNVLSSNNEKSYRFKKRYSFYPKNDTPCRIDMTIVKSSVGNNIIKSNVFNSNEEYQTELEFIPNKSNDNITETFEKFMKMLCFLIKLDHNTKFLLSEAYYDTRLISYSNLVFNDSKLPQKTKHFIGADVMSLKVNNLYQSNEKNILQNYAVTDKADGERMFLFVPSNNTTLNNDSVKTPEGYIEVFMINNRLNIMRTGLYVNKTTKYHENGGTLIDGEYIASRDLYLAFDLLFYKGEDYRISGKAKNLHARIEKLVDIQKKLNKDKEVFRLPNSRFIFKSKNFKFIDSDGLSIENSEKLLFDNNQSIWDNKSNVKIFSEWIKGQTPLTPYHLDGLIFTPINIPYPRKGGRWEYLFKWKPPMLNSIDFLVKIVKEGEQEKISYYKSDEYTTNYKSVNLYVGKLFQKGRDSVYGPTPFVISIDGSEPFAQIANIPLNENKQMIARDPLSGDESIILNDTIVEFSYAIDENKIFRWKPIRVRFDKTEAYLKNKSIAYTANDIETAFGVWDSMTNPISENVITGKEEKPTISKYYKDRKKDDRIVSSIAGLRDFHNRFVKKQLISGFIEDDGIDKHLLDLSCGQGGDIPRWIEAKGMTSSNTYASILGIDISKDNIYEPNGGALDRKIKHVSINKSKKIPSMTFVWGNSANNILTGEVAANEDEKTKLFSYFTKNIPGGIPGKVFDTISIQFSIHYFFDTKKRFYGLMNNIIDLLKDADSNGNNGGYVLITTLDGDVIDSKLAGLNFNDEIFKNDPSGKKMWGIKKLYKQYNANKSRGNKYGYKVAAYVESIGQYFNEYLVSPSVLRTVMEKAGLIQITSYSFEELYGQMKSMPNSQKIFQSAMNMTTEEKEYSFMHRMYVFRKVKKPKEDFSKIVEYEDVFGVPLETADEPTVMSVPKTETSLVDKKSETKSVIKVKKVSAKKVPTVQSSDTTEAVVGTLAAETPVVSAPSDTAGAVTVDETLVAQTPAQSAQPAQSTPSDTAGAGVEETVSQPKVKKVVKRVVRKVSAKKDDSQSSNVPSFTGLPSKLPNE